MTRLRTNISANLLSNVWSTGLSLVLTPIYVNFLGVESYGLLGFYLSWVAILGILDTGISSAALRQIAWLNARSVGRVAIPTFLRSVELTYWGIVGMVGVVILGGAWFFGEGWFHVKDLAPGIVRDTLMLMAISLIAQIPSGLYVSGLVGLQRQVESSALLAFFGTVRGLGAAILLAKISTDIRLFFVWQIVASLLQTFVVRWSLWKSVRIPGQRASFSSDSLVSVKTFAGGMILITIIGVVITQADKMILSRMISLRMFGFYVLAWTVASGLSRVATPLIQAFSPRFTELVSRDEQSALVVQHRLAAQLMSALVLPPAALISFASKPILTAWTANTVVAEGAASILTVIIVGSAVVACSYPALSVLYARHQLKPVVIVNLSILIAWLPLLWAVIREFGAIGAAFCWVAYGVALYLSYQALALRGLSRNELSLQMLRDFAAPGIVSIAIAWIALPTLRQVQGKGIFVILLCSWLLVGWVTALMVVNDLRTTLLDMLRWQTRPIL